MWKGVGLNSTWHTREKWIHTIRYRYRILVQYIYCMHWISEEEREENSLEENKYSALTCVIVRSRGTDFPQGCMCVSAMRQILQVVIPHPSGLTSLSTDPLRAADQELADIESFPRDLKKQKQQGNIDGHVTFHSLFTQGTQMICFHIYMVSCYLCSGGKSIKIQ